MSDIKVDVYVTTTTTTKEKQDIQSKTKIINFVLRESNNIIVL